MDCIGINGATGLSPKEFRTDPVAYIYHAKNEIAKKYGRVDLCAVASPDTWQHLLNYIENYWLNDRKMPVHDIRSFMFHGVVFFKSDFRRGSISFYRMISPADDVDFEPVAVITNCKI